MNRLSLRSLRPALGLPLALAALVVAACSDDDPASPTAPPVPPPMVAPQPQSAIYEVTFDATWTEATHPVDFPDNPHFSTLIGGTHNRRASFWDEGRVASAGIEAMAERGRTTPLDSEIRAAIAAGNGGELFVDRNGIGSPARTTLRFTATQGFPLVTLVTMVAPSPDWFVGVSGLDLFAGGVWLEQRVVPLYPWDAGTDDGFSFASPDREATPHQPVFEIRSSPLAPTGMAAPMGTFTFRRVG